MRNLLRKWLNRSAEPPFTITQIVPERVEILPESVTAAKWWGDLLREPSEHPSGEFFGQRPPTPTPEQVTVFETSLSELISEELARHGRDVGIVVLTSDYHPLPGLSDALAQAGIRDTYGIFPRWATMTVQDGTVRAKMGINQEYQDIPVQ